MRIAETAKYSTLAFWWQNPDFVDSEKIRYCLNIPKLFPVGLGQGQAETDEYGWDGRGAIALP
jgi:hypothetical protein